MTSTIYILKVYVTEWVSSSKGLGINTNIKHFVFFSLQCVACDLIQLDDGGKGGF